MTQFDPEKITFFAKTDARGHDVPFGIKAKDRQRHMYVIGKTGMGKSTLLENMAAQDILNGEGMAFIDPHGSAAEKLLNYVPEHRVKDVVYFAPFDLNYPVSFNVMEDVGRDKRHLVVSGLMSTFKKVWVDAWSARMEYILTNALSALIEYPDTTLLSVNRLFSDDAYRKKVVDYIQDDAVKSFWLDEFASYTDRFKAESLPAIQNKIGQFTGNPLIRNIIGQPHSSFDIRQMMDEKKILIMNLSKGLIGETNANLLGSMLTTRIYLAAMSRADLPVEKMQQMPNFYFYVDEFQSFANATFANILSEARKYHLNLIIAHQYIDQMEEEVRSAVFGNVGTTITFRVGPLDAEVLEKVFAPRFMAVDLVNLGFAQIYLSLMIDGIGSQPFSAKTLPSIKFPSTSCREMVIESSRQHYSAPREEVEQKVIELNRIERKPEVKKGGDKKFNNNNGGGGQRRDDRFSSFNNATNNNNSKRNFDNKPNRTNGNDNNDQVSKTSFQPKSQVETKKSPDDLRAVLSQMAKLERPEKKAEASPEKVVALEKKIEVKSENNLQNNQPQKSNNQEIKSEKSDPSNHKLKEALSLAINQISNVPEKKPETEPVKPVFDNRVEKFVSKQKDEKLETKKDDNLSLSDLVGKLQAKHKDMQVEKNSSKVTESTDKKNEKKYNVEKNLKNREEKSNNNKKLSIETNPFVPRSVNAESKIRRVVVEHDKRYQASDFLINKNNFSEERTDNEQNTGKKIDPTLIKKMLRTETEERSPFN